MVVVPTRELSFDCWSSNPGVPCSVWRRAGVARTWALRVRMVAEEGFARGDRLGHLIPRSKCCHAGRHFAGGGRLRHAS